MRPSGVDAERGRPRPLDAGRVFLAAVGLAYILPVWLIRFFPTQDGPSHVANAVALAGYGRNAIYQQYFRLNLAPVPNWASHVALAGLVRMVPPLVAEKLLITLYALLFPLAVFYLLTVVQGRASTLLALLGFVFMYNYLLNKGFYNFSLSIPMYLFSVGYWWRHRRDFAARQAALLAALLVLTYFCHPVALVLALATIALLALPGLADRAARRRRLALAAALAPATLLTLWYVHRQPPEMAHHAGVRVLYDGLVGLRVLATYPAQRLVAVATFGLVVALLAYTLVERFNLLGWDATRYRGEGGPRPADSFFLVAMLLVGIYFVAPDRMSGGSFISQRLSLFPFLALLPALSAPRPPRLRAAFALAIAGVVGLQLALTVHYDRTLSADLAEFTSGVPAVRKGRTLVALSFNQYGAIPGNRAGVFEHAVGYYAAATGGVDLGDYEGDTGYFPLSFNPALRRGVDRPDPIALLRRPGELRLASYAGRVDYIITWCMPADAPVAASIRHLYHPVYVSAGGRLRVFARGAPSF